jgi:hypothetical protein
MSEIGILMPHFSDHAFRAVSGAERFAQDARDSDVGAHHLLWSTIRVGAVGARAVESAGISRTTLTELLPPHDSPRYPGTRKPQKRARRQHNEAHRLLRPSTSSINRIANNLFSRVRHPPERNDFQHAVLQAFRLSQERPDRLADTGDLLLAVSEVVVKSPVGIDLATIGFEPATLMPTVAAERRRHPETRQPPPDPRP